MSTDSPTWSPPAATGDVLLTPAWRIVTYRSWPADDTTRVYVGLTPADLIRGYESIFTVLQGEQLNHRHARSAQVMRSFDGETWWAGKAILIDVPPAADPEALATRLDQALAGGGLSGPPALAGARPFGGRSGLLFLQRTDDSAGPADDDPRKQRLARLLGR